MANLHTAVARGAALIAEALEIVNTTYEGLNFDNGGSNGPSARRLLYEAKETLADVEKSVRTGGDLSEAGDDIGLAIAMVLGARDMQDAHRALPLMLRDVPATLGAAWNALDEASIARSRKARAAQATT